MSNISIFSLKSSVVDSNKSKPSCNGLSKCILNIYSLYCNKVKSTIRKLYDSSGSLDIQMVYRDIENVIRKKVKHSCSDEQINNIASAFMVTCELAYYKKKKKDADRVDFSLIFQKKNILKDSDKVKSLYSLIQNMDFQAIREFYINDDLVIPIKGRSGFGVFITAKRMIATRWLAIKKMMKFSTKKSRKSSFKQDLCARLSSKLCGNSIRNLNELEQNELLSDNYVLRHKYGYGHVTMSFNFNKKDYYISHHVNKYTFFNFFRVCIPGLSVKSVNCTYDYDYNSSDIPAYIVPIKNLDVEKVYQYVESSKNYKYNLFTYNCATKVGNMILSGLPESYRKNVHVPKFFWTPYDVQVLSQQVWKLQYLKC